MPRFFAIRHVPTGGFLPSVNSYGFTRTEPSRTDPPRLFVRRASATQALDWWLKGEAYEDICDNGDELNSREIRIKVIPKSGRDRSAMQIVSVLVTVLTPDQERLHSL